MTARLDYYNRVNLDLLQLLPADAPLIVEFGCGAGAMAEAYKRIHPHGQYVGIERHPEAAELARHRMDRVVVGNLEELDAAALQIAPQSVDCLVYGDVLEHLADPWTALKRHADLLREGGQVLACIPNIQHGSILLELLRGRWEYQEEGLLDRTHLRFFTFEGIQQLFAQAGLQIYDLKTRCFPIPGWDRIRGLLEPAVDALGIDRERFAAQTSALQYLVMAVRGQLPRRRLLIQTLIGCPEACGAVRVLEPDRFSSTLPGVRTHATVGRAGFDVAREDEEKVFILQRAGLRDPQDLDSLRDLLARDYLIVSEFDDNPLRWETHQANRFLSFRGVHAVQTSTEPLAEFLRRHNPNVAVFANQLAELPPPRTYSDNEPVTLFFGALNREQDWAPLMPTLNRVLCDLADKVRIRVIYDRAFFDALQTPHRDFTPYCPYPRYQEILGSCDIGLLPLEPTPFNVMKSDLKFIECGGHGVAVLASPVVYDQTIREGVTGLLFRSPDEFETRLRDLIRDGDLRRRLAGAAYEYVKQHRLLSQHYGERRDWYLRLRDDLPRLNGELRGRVPELFAN